MIHQFLATKFSPSCAIPAHLLIDLTTTSSERPSLPILFAHCYHFFVLCIPAICVIKILAFPRFSLYFLNGGECFTGTAYPAHGGRRGEPSEQIPSHRERMANLYYKKPKQLLPFLWAAKGRGAQDTVGAKTEGENGVPAAVVFGLFFYCGVGLLPGPVCCHEPIPFSISLPSFPSFLFIISPAFYFQFPLAFFLVVNGQGAARYLV